MAALKHIQTGVKLVATACLLLQMVNAVLTYLRKPTISSPEEKPLDSLSRPILVAVCRESQFNYSRAYTQGHGGLGIFRLIMGYF